MHRENIPRLSQTDASDRTSTGGEEVSMRRALGLADHPAASRHGYQGPGASDRFAQRRRFAADGQVPVVISGQQNQGADGAHSSGLTPLVTKLAAMESALRAEKESHHRIERALNEAHTTIRDLQTKLGHSILERDEAREAGRRSETGRLALKAALGAERTAQQSKQDGYQPEPESHGSAFGHGPTKPLQATAPEPGEAPVKRRGRPPGSTNSKLPLGIKAAKPVRWW